MGMMRREDSDTWLNKDNSTRHQLDGRIMEQIANQEIDEEFEKNTPNVGNLRKLLERREHMSKMRVFQMPADDTIPPSTR